MKTDIYMRKVKVQKVLLKKKSIKLVYIDNN